MADPRWWDPRPMQDQRERMGSGFGYNPRFYDPRDDPRTRRDLFNEPPPPRPTEPPAQAQIAEPAARSIQVPADWQPPPVQAAPPPQQQPPGQQPGLLSMMSNWLQNPANPGAGPANARNSYGPIPGAGPAAVDPRMQTYGGLLAGQMGMNMMQGGNPLQGMMGGLSPQQQAAMLAPPRDLRRRNQYNSGYYG